MPFVGNSTLKVGALVEPLTAQMADYLGVQNGLMVKQVARKSEAAAAGMKAFDVILKVGADNIATVSDWDRSMRANQGKAVQVTILARQEAADADPAGGFKEEERTGILDGLLRWERCPLMAFADPDVAFWIYSTTFDLDESAVQSMRDQGEALKDQLRRTGRIDSGNNLFEITPQQAEEFRKQAEEFATHSRVRTSAFDQKQMDEMKQQMEQFNKHFFGCGQLQV